jgi:hypothetical protein
LNFLFQFCAAHPSEVELMEVCAGPVAAGQRGLVPDDVRDARRPAEYAAAVDARSGRPAY